jgi:hypothetical protein
MQAIFSWRNVISRCLKSNFEKRARVWAANMILRRRVPAGGMIRATTALAAVLAWAVVLGRALARAVFLAEYLDWPGMKPSNMPKMCRKMPLCTGVIFVQKCGFLKKFDTQRYLFADKEYII